MQSSRRTGISAFVTADGIRRNGQAKVGVLSVSSWRLNAVRVAQATGTLPENLNFAIKFAIAIGFMDANSVAYSVRPSLAILEVTKITEIAEKYTGFVGCWK